MSAVSMNYLGALVSLPILMSKKDPQSAEKVTKLLQQMDQEKERLQKIGPIGLSLPNTDNLAFGDKCTVGANLAGSLANLGKGFVSFCCGNGLSSAIELGSSILHYRGAHTLEELGNRKALAAELEKFKQSNRDLTDLVADLRKQNETLKAREKELADQNAVFQRENYRLETSNRRFDQELDALAKSHGELSEIVRNGAETYELYKKAIKLMRKELAHLNNTYKGLTKEVQLLSRIREGLSLERTGLGEIRESLAGYVRDLHAQNVRV